MNAQPNPVRTTVVYGLLSAAGFGPMTMALWAIAGHIPATALTFSLTMLGYWILLIRWSGKSVYSILMPGLLLVGFCWWTPSMPVLIVSSTILLAWVRTGICFPVHLKAFLAEIITAVAANCGMVLFHPHLMIVWSLCIWLFFLIQSLYFPLSGHLSQGMPEPASDPFETAKQRVEQILANE